MSYQAAQKSIVIAVKAPPFLEAHLDADLVSRLMVNLLTNAIKLQNDDARVRLEIADEGYGMTEEQCRTLFQKYQRTDQAKEKRIVGTGLGLYLVNLICTAHGGDITVRSKLGEGTTFNVVLPLVQVSSTKTSEQKILTSKKF